MLHRQVQPRFGSEPPQGWKWSHWCLSGQAEAQDFHQVQSSKRLRVPQGVGEHPCRLESDTHSAIFARLTRLQPMILIGASTGCHAILGIHFFSPYATVPYILCSACRAVIADSPAGGRPDTSMGCSKKRVPPGSQVYYII